MKNLLITLFLALNTSVSAAGLDIPDYTPDKITDRIFVIHGPLEMPNPANRGFMNNPIIGIGDEGVVIIDPGSSLYAGKMVLRALDKLTDLPITHVIGTHVHGDHWLGNHAIKMRYPGAAFLAHPTMIEMANGGEADSWLQTMLTLTEGATEGTEAVIPDRPLEDGQMIKVPGLPMRIHLSEKAHTSTDAMIEFVDESVVVLGDNALLGRIGRMDDGSFKGNVEALEHAVSLAAKWYVPGHGRTTGSEAATEYRDYLRAIFEAAVAGSEDMMAPFEIKDSIEDRFEHYKEWPGFGAEFGKHISLAVLEAENDAF